MLQNSKITKFYLHEYNNDSEKMPLKLKGSMGFKAVK